MSIEEQPKNNYIIYKLFDGQRTSPLCTVLEILNVTILLDCGIEPGFRALQADSLLSKLPRVASL